MSDPLDSGSSAGGAPDAFGSFRALHQVGGGTLGPVFRAYDADRERLVAVKLFTLDLEPVRVEQLVAEFERLIVADLNHPVIGRVLATGIYRGSAYIVQEHIPADSLDVVLRQYGRPPTTDALRVAAQLAGALDFAAVVNHYHGALHSKDVLLSADETRLTGIGIAQALQRVGIATPLRRPYTAPELRRGSPLDRRADIFGLAVVVHELLGGSGSPGPPNAIELRTEIAECDVAALQRVFGRALDENPGSRYRTALQFVDALTCVLSGSERHVGNPQAPQATPASAGTPQPVHAQIDTPLGIDDIRRPVATLSERPTARSEHSRRSARFRAHAKPAASPRRRQWSASQLLLALAVGLAVGAADRYRVGRHDPAPPRAAPSNRDSEASTQSAKRGDLNQSERPFADATPAATPPQPTASATNRAGSTSAPEGDKVTVTRPPAQSVGGTDPLAGMLFIDSRPRGATLFLDEKMIGTTPLAVSAITAGEHALRVESDGYRAWSAPVHVASNQLNRVLVTLDR